MISRRHMLLGGVALAARPWAAHANRSLTLLVGAREGSASDEVARAFVPFLARHLPFTDIGIRNLPGGAGLVAYHALADMPPAGNVLGWAMTPTLPARMVDRGGTDLLQRLTLLGAVQKEPIAIVSPAATPLGSVQDLIGRSADDADGVPFGTPSPGSPPHLAALRLQSLAGTRLNIVAFPSAAAARQAALAGNVAAAALGLTDAIGDLREGRLVGLGIAATNRSDIFPDMPPLRDVGLNLSAFIYRGLVAPAGLAAGDTADLQTALQAVVADPEFHDQANASGFVATWITGETWAVMAEAERARLEKLWATEPWLQEGAG